MSKQDNDNTVIISGQRVPVALVRRVEEALSYVDVEIGAQEAIATMILMGWRPPETDDPRAGS